MRRFLYSLESEPGNTVWLSINILAPTRHRSTFASRRSPRLTHILVYEGGNWKLKCVTWLCGGHPVAGEEGGDRPTVSPRSPPSSPGGPGAMADVTAHRGRVHSWVKIRRRTLGTGHICSWSALWDSTTVWVLVSGQCVQHEASERHRQDASKVFIISSEPDLCCLL